VAFSPDGKQVAYRVQSDGGILWNSLTRDKLANIQRVGSTTAILAGRQIGVDRGSTLGGAKVLQWRRCPVGMPLAAKKLREFPAD